MTDQVDISDDEVDLSLEATTLPLWRPEPIPGTEDMEDQEEFEETFHSTRAFMASHIVKFALMYAIWKGPQFALELGFYFFWPGGWQKAKQEWEWICGESLRLTHSLVAEVTNRYDRSVSVCVCRTTIGGVQSHKWLKVCMDSNQQIRETLQVAMDCTLSEQSRESYLKRLVSTHRYPARSWTLLKIVLFVSLVAPARMVPTLDDGLCHVPVGLYEEVLTTLGEYDVWNGLEELNDAAYDLLERLSKEIPVRHVVPELNGSVPINLTHTFYSRLVNFTVPCWWLIPASYGVQLLVYRYLGLIDYRISFVYVTVTLVISTFWERILWISFFQLTLFFWLVFVVRYGTKLFKRWWESKQFMDQISANLDGATVSPKVTYEAVEGGYNTYIETWRRNCGKWMVFRELVAGPSTNGRLPKESACVQAITVQGEKHKSVVAVYNVSTLQRANCVKIKQAKNGVSLFLGPAHIGVGELTMDGGSVIGYLVLERYDLVLVATMGHTQIPCLKWGKVLPKGEVTFYSARYGRTVAAYERRQDGANEYLCHQCSTYDGDCGSPLEDGQGKCLGLHLRGRSVSGEGSNSNGNWAIGAATIEALIKQLFPGRKESFFSYQTMASMWVEEFNRQNLSGNNIILNGFRPKVIWDSGTNRPKIVIPMRLAEHGGKKFNAWAFQEFGLDVTTPSDLIELGYKSLSDEGNWGEISSYPEDPIELDQKLQKAESLIDEFNSSTGKVERQVVAEKMMRLVDRQVPGYKEQQDFAVQNDSVLTNYELDVAARNQYEAKIDKAKYRAGLEESKAALRKGGKVRSSKSAKAFWKQNREIEQMQQMHGEFGNRLSGRDDELSRQSGKVRAEDVAGLRKEACSIALIRELSPELPGCVEIDPGRPKPPTNIKAPEQHFPGYLWPDLGNEQTSRSFFKHQLLNAQRRLRFAKLTIPSSKAVKEIVSLYKPFVTTQLAWDDLPKLKEQLRQWAMSSRFTDMSHGAVGWDYDMIGIKDKGTLVGRVVDKSTGKVSIVDATFEMFWKNLQPVLSGDKPPVAYVFPKPELHKEQKIIEGMNRLVYNLDAYYNILFAFAFQDVLAARQIKATPIGFDTQTPAFCELVNELFPENHDGYRKLDVKKSDSGMLPQHVDIGSRIIKGLYGDSSPQLRGWESVMKAGLIYHLPDGSRFRKDYDGYMVSGMWCTTFMNSLVYWVCLKSWADKILINGDDTKLILKKGVKDVEAPKCGIEVSYDDKDWCSVETRVLGVKELDGRKVVVTNPTDGSVVEIDLLLEFGDYNLKLFHNTGAEKSLVNYLSRGCSPDALRAAALNFSVDPSDFIAKWKSVSDVSVSEEADFRVMCNQALYSRITKMHESDVGCVEWAEQC